MAEIKILSGSDAGWRWKILNVDRGLACDHSCKHRVYQDYEIWMKDRSVKGVWVLEFVILCIYKKTEGKRRSCPSYRSQRTKQAIYISKVKYRLINMSKISQTALLRVLAQRLRRERVEELVESVNSATSLNQLHGASNVAVGAGYNNTTLLGIEA